MAKENPPLICPVTGLHCENKLCQGDVCLAASIVSIASELDITGTDFLGMNTAHERLGLSETQVAYLSSTIPTSNVNV